MPSTTVKLPEALKARIAPLARAAGLTPHAWMVRALETQVAQDELRRAFVDEAKARLAAFERTGEVLQADDVHRYLRTRAAGGKATRPRPVRWRK